MFGWGPHWNFFDIIQGVASFFAGVLIFLIWLAVLLLFVRFLLIATRAAKVYLRSHGEHDGILPQRSAPVAPAAPAAPAATTKPAPRTPKPKI